QGLTPPLWNFVAAFLAVRQALALMQIAAGTRHAIAYGAVDLLLHRAVTGPSVCHVDHLPCIRTKPYATYYNYSCRMFSSCPPVSSCNSPGGMPKTARGVPAAAQISSNSSSSTSMNVRTDVLCPVGGTPP